MKQEVFVLRMTGVQDQLIVAQSEEELAFRLYGNKIEHPTAQMFLDTGAVVGHVGTVYLGATQDDGFCVSHKIDEWKTIQSYLDLASENMAKRRFEVLPND